MAEHRPADDEYYGHDRTELLSQGDLFRDVPLGYPTVLNEIDEEEEGMRTPESRKAGWRWGSVDFSPARSTSAQPCSSRRRAR